MQASISDRAALAQARTGSAGDRRRWWAALAAAAILGGLVARLLPFADPDGRMLRQFPTEDGYLMQTIARNVAAGHGLSTAAGTIPTNGTQPLATFVYAAGHWLAGGDRTAGIAWALGIQVVVALLAALAIVRLARGVLPGATRASCAAPLVAAAVWFASPLSARHGMSCLETGPYVLAVALFAGAFVRAHPAGGGSAGWRSAAWLGVACGIVLWTRIDAVFLLAAACLAWAFLDARCRIRLDTARLAQAALLGAVATAVLSPWLLHNRLEFGSFTPISGRSESYGAQFGDNLAHLPAALFEALYLVLPIPTSMEAVPWVALACALGAVAWIALLVRALRAAEPGARLLFALAGLFALGLCGYYGLLFGVEFFLARYLFPLSAFAAVGWVLIASSVAHARAARPAFAAGALAAIGVLAIVHVRLWRGGREHMHFQVVAWIEANVPAETWVGAVQTGTIGYFHDRTLNLDGKVNPEALEAVLARRIPDYVLSKPIRYLADWEGIASWAELPELKGRFDVVVHDRERNLAVLARREGS